MVQLSGIYDNGNITLEEKIITNKPVNVIVTFMDEQVSVEGKRLSINDFSFMKSREQLAGINVNLSDTVIEERRNGL